MKTSAIADRRFKNFSEAWRNKGGLQNISGLEDPFEITLQGRMARPNYGINHFNALPGEILIVIILDAAADNGLDIFGDN